MNVWGQLIERPPLPVQVHIAKVIEEREAMGRPPKTDRQQMTTPWGLSASQCAVMNLLLEGMGNSQIGAKLGIGSRAVEGHLTRAYALMDLQGDVRRVQAAIAWDRFIRSGQQ